MIKFAFKIKTRSGMVIDDLQMGARDQAEAERKVGRIYQRCEILHCSEAQHEPADEGFDLESVINLITHENERGSPGKA